MENTKLSLVYGIGSHACTKEYFFSSSSFLNPLQKQISSSFPFITSITVKAMNQKKKRELFSIYVGKELNLNAYNDSYIEKYDIDLEELERLRDAGYERVCLLNYKKYDSVMIGLKKRDKVVPDYYALKRNLLNLERLHRKVQEV